MATNQTPYLKMDSISGSPSAKVVNDLQSIAANQVAVDRELAKSRVVAKAWAKTNITLTALNQGLGVAVGDVVIATGQNNAAENGVYFAAAGAWTRHPLFAINTDVSTLMVTVLDADNSTLALSGQVGASFKFKVLGKTKEAVVMFVPGALQAGLMLVMLPVYPMTYSANMAGSRAQANTAPTASTTIDIRKAGVSIGSLTFAANSKTGVFSGIAAGSLAITDSLEFQCAAPNGMSDLSVSLLMEK